MATNLDINERLLTEALRIGHLRTKKETVNTALLEFIQKRKQKELLKIFGKIDFVKDYDYKKYRSRK